jgi:hypothetical protein
MNWPDDTEPYTWKGLIYKLWTATLVFLAYLVAVAVVFVVLVAVIGSTM